MTGSRLPLSYAQQRLYFLFRLDGPDATFNMPLAFTLTGPLGASALELAIGDVAERHEILRTVYREADGEPYQHILAAGEAPPRLTMRDCRPEELRALVAEAASTVFDLAVDPPLRAWLFRTAEQEHTLVLLLHHIAFDAYSAGPLYRDLETAYTARAAGRVPDFKPLPIQYGDYTLWQRDLLGEPADPDSVHAEQLAYWRRALADLPAETVLPTDRPRPAGAAAAAGADRAGGAVPIQLEAMLHRRLEEVAREAGVTLFMVFQAALGVLLHRLGAGQVVPVGTVVAGRTEDGLEPLVGFFVNTLVLRTDVGGDPAFGALLARVREAGLAAYEHQDLPFEALVAELNPVRSAGRGPLFQVLLAFDTEAAEPDGPRLPGIRATPLDADPDAAKFDLSFYLVGRQRADGAPAGVEGRVEYASALF